LISDKPFPANLREYANDQIGKVLDRFGWGDWIGYFVPNSGLCRLAKWIVSLPLAHAYGSFPEGAGAGYAVVMQRQVR